MSNRHFVSAIFILTYVLLPFVSLGQQSQSSVHGGGTSAGRHIMDSKITDNNNPDLDILTCRHPSHGVESYQRTFSVTKASPELDGRLGRDKWCNYVTNSLAREFPGGKFTVLSADERQRIHSFNFLGYIYTCAVRVNADPVYKIAAGPTCHP